MSMIKLLAPLFKEGWYLTAEGKVSCDGLLPSPETPWSAFNISFNCKKWWGIFFRLVSNRTMVHSHCQECYKVVVRPRTIEELDQLEQFQAATDFECKCGIELREYTPHLYGGYFYCRGLEAGRERYRDIKEWVESCWDARHIWADDTSLYPEPMDIILKLGCSEFERAVGPSNLYQVTEKQKHLEDELDKILDFDPFYNPQDPESAKARTHEMWIDFAFAAGDKTYLKFMPDRKPIGRQFITYHESEEENAGKEN